MTMECKAKLTATEAEALKEYRMFKKTNEEAIEYYIKNNKTWVMGFEPLKDMGLEKFCQAVICGYEIEKTPAQRLKEWYDQEVQMETRQSKSIWYNGTMQTPISYPRAIKKTLDILGIQIEGINKEESK
jgi:hypothetical protein